MAYSFSVNTTPATGAVAMYGVIATLIAAGWTIKASGDGLAQYDAAGGTAVTSGAAGAFGLGNPSAWVRIQAPAVNGGAVVNQKREFTFQRGASDRGWRIKYGASAGFTLGVPGITRTPSSADEVFMTGGGTDAAPTYTVSWMAADGSYRWHIACGGAAEFYSFCAFGVSTGTTLLVNGMLLDVMATGSFPATDVDPAVTFCSAAFSGYGVQAVFAQLGNVLVNTTNPALARAWLGATSAAGAATVGTNSQYVAMTPYGSTNSSVAGGANTLGTNPFTAKDDLLPAWWLRPGSSVAPIGLKGCSTLFMFGSVLRTTMDTLDTAGVKDKVFINPGGVQIWQPWSGVAPVI